MARAEPGRFTPGAIAQAIDQWARDHIRSLLTRTTVTEADITALQAEVATLQVHRDAVCQVYDASQSINDSAVTTINPWGTVDLDPLSWSVGSGQIQPTIAGWYRARGGFCVVTAANDISSLSARIQVNGASPFEYIRRQNPSSQSLRHEVEVVTPLILMNGTTDDITLAVFQDNSTNTARAVESFLTVELVYPV